MSGSVWQVEVEEGAVVKAGQTLLVLESMKMEIPVQAPCDGVVSRMLLEPGNRVSAGKALVVLSES